MKDADGRTLLVKKLREIQRGSLAAIVLKVLAAALSFATQIILTRFLSIEHYGHYIYVMTWVNLCVLLGTQGYTTASVRFIPEYASQSQLSRLRGYIAHSRRRILAGSLLAGTLLAIGAQLFIQATPSLRLTFIAGGVTIPLLAYLYGRAAELRAFKRIIRAALSQEVFRQVVLIGGIAGLIGTHIIESTAVNAMLVHLVAIGLMIGLTTQFFRHIRPAKLYARSATKHTNKWQHAAHFMLLTAAFNLLLGQADVLMVGAMVGTTPAGIYAVASKLATLVIFVIVAATTIFGPIVSELYQSKETNLLSYITNYVMSISASLSAVVAAILLIAPTWFLSLFGAEYVAGSEILMVLVIAQLVNAVFGPVTLILNMTNNQKKAARILSVSAVINVILNGILIAIMGEIGAAVATLSSMLVWNIWGFLVVKQQVGILTLPFIRSAQSRRDV